MNKQGILFQGLPVHRSFETSFLQEESSYRIQSESVQEEMYIDITYFLLYAMCGNVICRGKVRSMKKEREAYLLKQAEKSTYQGEYFWMCLENEEKRCAKLILGLLEDIRSLRDDRAEKGWISLWYLIHCGFRKEYTFLKKNRRITSGDLCRFAGEYGDRQFMGISQICMAFVVAEDLGVKVFEDEKYALLCSCVREGSQLWETGAHEILEECLKTPKKRK